MPPEPGPEHYQELLRLLEEERAAVEEAFQHEVEVEEEKAAIDRDACLAPSGEEWKLMLRREETLDRSIDRKIKLLLSLRKNCAQQASSTGTPACAGEGIAEGQETGKSACPTSRKLDDRSGNVDENKGPLTSAAGQREVPAPSEQQMGDARVGITVAWPCGTGILPVRCGAGIPSLRSGQALQARGSGTLPPPQARRPCHLELRHCPQQIAC